MAEQTNGTTSLNAVREYYGKILKKSDDLKTNACCTAEMPEKHLRKALGKVADEVLSKYYGCGLVLPDCLEGRRVLDLGCGAGRDVYVISQFVGEKGSVVGVDMTEEQLEVANRYKEHHREAYGYAKGNVEFKHGYIERLQDMGLEDDSFDVVVSNCVLNLSMDKEAVLKEVFRVLKPGGEFYFSDVYSERRVPEKLQKDPVLWGECLSGALYWNDFVRLSQRCGFKDPRLVKDDQITIQNKQVEDLIGHIRFFSGTYRLFKLPQLEPDCEDYGQAVVYKGTIAYRPEHFLLDAHHDIQTGKIFPVCGNTWHMLASTRFAEHFDFLGDFSKHFGIYDGCGRSLPFASAYGAGAKGGGCC